MCDESNCDRLPQNHPYMSLRGRACETSPAYSAISRPVGLLRFGQTMLAISVAHLARIITLRSSCVPRNGGCRHSHPGLGNKGARNATRGIGWRTSIMAAVLDFGKWAIAIAWARHPRIATSVQLLTGLGACLGHNLPLSAHFRRESGDGHHRRRGHDVDAGCQPLGAGYSCRLVNHSAPF